MKNMGNVTISLRMLRIEDFQISLNEERVLGLELTIELILKFNLKEVWINQGKKQEE